MPRGKESELFEQLLRRRGLDPARGADVEVEILDRYEEDLAVLVLDACGCTRRTMQQGIIHFLSLIMAMRDQVGPVIGEHGAINDWFEVDNVYAMFHSAEQALRCSLRIQAVMARFNTQHLQRDTLSVCIGVGAGTMLRIGDEDVFGSEMNLASKLGEDIAGPKEVLITPQAHLRVRDIITEVRYELRTTHLSGVELKHYRVHY